LSTFAMGLIAITIGGHLSYRRLHNALRRIAFIAVGEVGGAVLLVSVTAHWMGADWTVALFMGAIAAATAPGTTVAVIREVRGKGSYVKTLLSVVALDNILCIILFAFVQTLIADYLSTGEVEFRLVNAIIHATWQLAGSVLIGIALGFATERLVTRPGVHDFSVVIIAVFLTTGVATYLGLNPLLASLFFGVYLGNRSREVERQLEAFEPIELLVYTSFFTLAGASLHLDTLSGAGLLCVGYVVMRFVGKGIGAILGGLAARSSRRIWENVPLALVPQAGVAIGLVVLLSGDARIPKEMSHLVTTLVLAAVTINEIIGPFFTRAALRRAKEAGLDRPRLMEFLQEEYILTTLKGEDKWRVLKELTDFLLRTHHVPRLMRSEIYGSIVEREKEMSTAIGYGAAIPHGRVVEGERIQGVLGICRDGVDFDAPDGEPVRIVMLVITPQEHEQRHLEVMASLAAMISDEHLRTRLIAAIDANDAWEVIEGEESRNYNYFLEQDEQEVG